jgi:hypothetical protein
MPDSFLIDPDDARKRLGLEDDDVGQVVGSDKVVSQTPIKCAPRTGMGSRYPGEILLSDTLIRCLSLSCKRLYASIKRRIIQSNSKDCSQSYDSGTYIFQAFAKF